MRLAIVSRKRVDYWALACETQTCAHLRLVIILIQAQLDGTTQIRTQIKMVLVGQPKLETILEEGDIHTNGNRKHKIRSTKLSSKLAPHNHYWTV